MNALKIIFPTIGFLLFFISLKNRNLTSEINIGYSIDTDRYGKLSPRLVVSTNGQVYP